MSDSNSGQSHSESDDSIRRQLEERRRQLELETNLLPSPPSSPSAVPGPAGSTSVTIRDETAPAAAAETHAPNGQLFYEAPDRSTRVYTFPAQPPQRARPSANGERIVTVRDLRNKTCWICSEDETEGDSNAESQARSSKKRFVHPCKCTLVAHESCLLAWIEQSKINHPLQESVTCPQCRAPYILIDPKPWILRALEGADRLVTQAVPIASASAVGGAVLVASAAYGCVAIRLALGKQASRRVLSSPWPWHFWFDITLIPYALIASRLRLFDTSLAYSSMTYATYVLAFPRLMTQFTNAQARFFPQPQRMYPPSPAQIGLVYPALRALYMAFKRRVTRAVLGPYLRKPSQTRRGEAQDGGAATTRRRTRIIVVGSGPAELLDADAPPGTEGLRDGAPQGEEDDGNVQTMFISHQSIGRLCLGALSLPFIANWTGHLLGWVARHSRTLSRFLGIQTSKPSSLLKPRSSPSWTRGSANPSPSPIGSLFHGYLPGFDEVEAADTYNGGASGLDDLDPVWFRNAIGASLFVVAKDAAALAYKYLKLRQRGQTRVVDLPFQSSLVSGLDLRDA